jgi:hypothetical protein
MNDEDLRDLFAGLALMGIVSRASNEPQFELVAKNAYRMADAMLDAKYADNVPEVGIAAVKKPRKTKEQL